MTSLSGRGSSRGSRNSGSDSTSPNTAKIASPVSSTPGQNALEPSPESLLSQATRPSWTSTRATRAENSPTDPRCQPTSTPSQPPVMVTPLVYGPTVPGMTTLRTRRPSGSTRSTSSMTLPSVAVTTGATASA
jgi:hypothetical protein